MKENIPQAILDAMHEAFPNISIDAEQLIYLVVIATSTNSKQLNSYTNDPRIERELGKGAKERVVRFAQSQRGRYARN